VQSVTKVFNGTDLSFVRNDEGDFCLSAEQIGQALGYAEPRKSVLKIVERHADEFDGLQGVVRLTTPGGEQDVTVFAEEGIYLVGMKATTKQAKAFRKWVAATLRDLRRGVIGLVTPADPNGAIINLANVLGIALPGMQAQIAEAKALAEAAPANALEAMKREQADASLLKGQLTKKVAGLVDEALVRGFFDGNKRAAFQSINADIRDRFGVRDGMPSDVLRVAIAYVDERHNKLTNPVRLELGA
jgi:prophage antirepressor-like protein